MNDFIKELALQQSQSNSKCGAGVVQLSFLLHALARLMGE
jgi:hypothetical protein